ncbi:MAG: hypothetical protein LBP95_12205 [Deltaproteobacteria bacterium]|nr:hypothetical protein [Deltaproteobacteria bacterium]
MSDDAPASIRPPAVPEPAVPGADFRQSGRLPPGPGRDDAPAGGAPASGRGPEDPPVFRLEEVSSTFDEAWRLVDLGRLPVFGSVLAGRQTGGRGRAGSVWSSPPGHVYASLRLPRGEPFSGTRGSLGLALLVCEALELAGGPRLMIKWPNDLVLDGAKVGGLLLESKKRALVAGVGLNLGAAPGGFDRDPQAPPAGALPGSLGPPRRLWPVLVRGMILCYNNWLRGFAGPGGDPGGLSAAVVRRLLWLGETVAARSASTTPPCPPGTLVGRIVGLDASGALLVENQTGTRAVWSGTLTLADEP